MFHLHVFVFRLIDNYSLSMQCWYPHAPEFRSLYGSNVNGRGTGLRRWSNVKTVHVILHGTYHVLCLYCIHITCQLGDTITNNDYTRIRGAYSTFFVYILIKTFKHSKIMSTFNVSCAAFFFLLLCLLFLLCFLREPFSHIRRETVCFAGNIIYFEHLVQIDNYTQTRLLQLKDIVHCALIEPENWHMQPLTSRGADSFTCNHNACIEHCHSRFIFILYQKWGWKHPIPHLRSAY